MAHNRSQDRKNEPNITLGFPPSDDLYQINQKYGQEKWEEMGQQLHKIHSELTRSGQISHARRIRK